MPAATTRYLDGFQQRSFTVDDIIRMQEAGIIDEAENFELIEGEILPMGPKFYTHERIKSLLGMAVSQACPEHLIVGFETSLFLSSSTFVEPDLCLYDRSFRSEDVRGPDVLLAIEVAVSSLAYDRGLKAGLYARYGVQELWVVDATRHITIIHTGPSEAGWASVIEKASDETLTFAALPGFAAVLSTM